MLLKEALLGSIDANLYLLHQNESLSALFVIGYPFRRAHDLWEFRFFNFSSTELRFKGTWDADAWAGWVIEGISLGNPLRIFGDEVGVECYFTSKSTAHVAVEFLTCYPLDDALMKHKLLECAVGPATKWERLTLEF